MRAGLLLQAIFGIVLCSVEDSARDQTEEVVVNLQVESVGCAESECEAPCVQTRPLIKNTIVEDEASGEDVDDEESHIESY